MVGNTLMGILGIAFIIGAIMQFRCTGPIWSAEYVAATVQERRQMETKQEYYWSGIGCLYIGVLFLLSLIGTLTELRIILYVIFVVSALLFLHIIYGVYRAIHKNTLHRR